MSSLTRIDGPSVCPSIFLADDMRDRVLAVGSPFRQTGVYQQSHIHHFCQRCAAMYSRSATLIRLPRFPAHDMAAFDHPQGVRTKDSVVTHSNLPLPGCQPM